MSVAIEERSRKIFVEHLGVDAGAVKADAELEGLGADSLDKIDLVMAFEEEFGHAISDDEAEKLDTFGDFVTFVTAAEGFGENGS